VNFLEHLDNECDEKYSPMYIGETVSQKNISLSGVSIRPRLSPPAQHLHYTIPLTALARSKISNNSYSPTLQ
jgi:hypothetical protein